MANDTAFHASDLDAPASSRILWTPPCGDLHLNVVALDEGESIPDHVNETLDVILTCLDGSGALRVDGTEHLLEAGSIVVIPRGANRSVSASDEGIRYTTVHRRRGGIIPTVQSKD